MKKIGYGIVITLISICCFSQQNPDRELFDKIIKENLSSSTFYLSCEKSRTFFDGGQFKRETGLKVPSNILEELEISSKKSRGGNWNMEFLNASAYVSKFLKGNCLIEEDVNALFEKTMKRHLVFKISEPIYDESRENCVISFSCVKFKGSAYGSSYFLKKVYGSWIVISIFNTWIT
ncbi:MAG: hypothetical protein V7724_10875 [Sediminicola sp.]